MARIGRGMLLILTDVDPAAEDDFNRWYDSEHMLERVSIPGFHTASRYVGTGSVRDYAALYWTDDIGVFQSAVYKEALSRQSAWSKRILKDFVDPHRAVGNVSKALGYGRGGYVGLVKLGLGPLSASARQEWHDGVMPAIAALPGIVSVQLFESAPHLSGPVAEYRPTTRPLAAPDDCILIVEGSSQTAVDWPALAPAMGDRAADCTPLGTYVLTWELDAADIERT